MEFRTDAKWGLVVPTSMGVRISPAAGQPVQASDHFFLQVTSAETNVASICSFLGVPTKVLTNFVKGSPIAYRIKSDLAGRHMVYEGPDIDQGGPWGYRHQFNIADSGYGNRGARVWNDRSGEVGRVLDAKDFDLERIFGDEGVKILHLSGLVAALGPQTTDFCLALVRAARDHGTAISFDLNYRASFWEGRETELRTAFTEIARLCTVLAGNEEDFQLALGLPGPQVGGEGLTQQIEAFQAMIQTTHEHYPDVEYVSTTLRQVINSNAHLWGAIMWHDGKFHVAEPRQIGVLDRVGGGDATIGGILYGLLQGWDAEKCLHFGWACGALAATLLTDYAMPADENEVWRIWEGNARIKR